MLRLTSCANVGEDMRANSNPASSFIDPSQNQRLSWGEVCAKPPTPKRHVPVSLGRGEDPRSRFDRPLGNDRDWRAGTFGDRFPLFSLLDTATQRTSTSLPRCMSEKRSLIPSRQIAPSFRHPHVPGYGSGAYRAAPLWPGGRTASGFQPHHQSGPCPSSPCSAAAGAGRFR